MAQQVTVMAVQALGPAFPLWKPCRAKESDCRLICTLALWHAHPTHDSNRMRTEGSKRKAIKCISNLQWERKEGGREKGKQE